MVSKRLMFTWAFFDICLLAAGSVTLALSFLWRQPNLLLNLTFSSFDLTTGTVLGIIFLGTFVSSLVLVPIRGTKSLVLLNWLLLVNALAILAVGTAIWFSTLHERNNYRTVFGMQSDSTKIAIQDKFQCCGYFNANDEVAYGGSFCPNVAAAMTANSFCVTPITMFADATLNDVFSTMYGFMSIVAGLFLANMCVIKRRQEEERFERIDAKSGSGFV